MIEQPIFKVVWNGKNVTTDIANYLIDLTFDDSTEDRASSVEVRLENEDGLWSNGWYPSKGDTITVSIGEMDCGTFTLDQVSLSGPPDTVKIHAVDHIFTTTELRTKRSKAHEKKSLRQIAQHVAQANNLTLVGTVPNIMFERVSQRRETDLKFLRRVAYDYGIVFTVRNKKLVYESLYDLDKRAAVFSLDKTDLIEYEITDKTNDTFKDAKVKYHNPKTKKIVSATSTASDVVTVRNNDGYEYNQIVSNNSLVVHKKVENTQQAEAVSKAHLYRANSKQQEGSFTFPGTRLAIAGNNLEVCGLGVAGSGIWNMRKITHSVGRDNAWKVKCDAARVAVVDKTKQRGKKTSKPKASGGASTVVTEHNRDGYPYTQIK